MHVWRSKFHYMDRIPDSAQANQEFPTNHGKHPVSHLMSGCIEILQSCCTDNRSGDWIDFIANCTGVCLASLAGHYIYRPFIQKNITAGVLTPSHKDETPGALTATGVY